MNLRGVKWRQEVLYLSVASMEICWLYPWFLLGHRLLGDSSHQASILFLFVPLLAALYLTRALPRLHLEMHWNRVIIALWAVVACLAALKYYLYHQYSLLDPAWLRDMARALANVMNAIPGGILVIVVVVLYLWWRGISLGQQSLTFAKVGFYFRLGIVVFIWYLFLVFFGPSQEVTLLVFVYFFFGLIAVALARIEQVSQLKGGIRSPFNAYWLGVLVLATIVVLLVALLASHVFSLQNAYYVLGWLRPLEPVLEAALYYVFMILGYLLQPLLEALILIANRLTGLGLPEIFTSQERPPELAATQAASSPDYLGILRGCVTVSILLAALVAVVLSLRRWRASREERGDAFRESLWSSDSIAQGLLGSVRSGWDRLGELAGMVRRFGVGRDLYSVISIRKIYASLVRLAEVRGYPRPAARTPYEYLDTLYRALPGSEAEVAAITEAYVGVHYGELPHSADDLRRIRECWARVRWRDEQRQRFGPGEKAGEGMSTR